MITFEQIANNEEIQAYIKHGDELLGAMGYTEHSMIHAARTSKRAGDMLETMDFAPREIELARIAGMMHDIGNMVNRQDHAQIGAVLAFNILTRMGMEPSEIAAVVGAIGNHDEGTGGSVTHTAAALILADKSDVRRSRVRSVRGRRNILAFDIHDRVNYAVEDTTLSCDKGKKTITLQMNIDTEICPVMDYFEIFIGRMMMCRRAADFFGMVFELIINGARLI